MIEPAAAVPEGCCGGRGHGTRVLMGCTLLLWAALTFRILLSAGHTGHGTRKERCVDRTTVTHLESGWHHSGLLSLFAGHLGRRMSRADIEAIRRDSRMRSEMVRGARLLLPCPAVALPLPHREREGERSGV